MAKLLFYDIETTGTDFRKNAIHQVGGLVEVNGEVKGQFNFHLRPFDGAEVDQAALEIGGVTREQLQAYPPFQEGHAQLVKMLSGYCDKFDRSDKFHLVGYNNNQFDNQFLRQLWTLSLDKYFGSWFWSDSIDVMVLAADRLKDERAKLLDFKLRTVATHLGLQIDETKLHNAAYDIELTRELYYKLSPREAK